MVVSLVRIQLLSGFKFEGAVIHVTAELHSLPLHILASMSMDVHAESALFDLKVKRKRSVFSLSRILA